MLFSIGPGFVYSFMDWSVLRDDFCSIRDFIPCRCGCTISFGISPTSIPKILTIEDLVTLFKSTEFSSNFNSLHALNALYSMDCPLLTLYIAEFSLPSSFGSNIIFTCSGVLLVSSSRYP